MGRKPKEPPSEEFFAVLAINDPDGADMKKKQVIIGKNIRKYRKLKTLSVEYLAEYLDLSASYVGLLERGDRCPSLKIVYRLHTLFGTTMDELLTESETARDTEIGEDGALYNEELQIEAMMSIFKALSPKGKESVINVAKEFLLNEKKS